jgi:murein peptide amidase A
VLPTEVGVPGAVSYAPFFPEQGPGDLIFVRIAPCWAGYGIMQRLGKNHGAYHGEIIAIREVLREIEAAAHRHGWEREVFHRSAGFDWLALNRRPATLNLAPLRVYLSAGIHGDEPAGPLAVLELLQQNNWPAGAEIYVLPCLNPVGCATNRRENGQGIDLNRDYLNPQAAEVRAQVAWLERQPPFDLTLCLHEDWEAHGFYVYELNPEGNASRAAAMVAAVAAVCPIDRSALIEGRPAQNGVIRAELDPTMRPLWPEAFWLLQHKTRLSYTPEAPSDFPLQMRVNALVTAVQAALADGRAAD